MALTIKIIDIHARQILDSRGNPTVEAEVTAQTETTGRKSVGRNLFRQERAPDNLRLSS